MRTIAAEMADRILVAEDEAVARFYDLVGFGDEYRVADTSDETRRLIREFREAGYRISRLELEEENTFRMILWYNGVVHDWLDITITIHIGSMGGA